jgi:hypothetical protein
MLKMPATETGHEYHDISSPLLDPRTAGAAATATAQRWLKSAIILASGCLVMVFGVAATFASSRALDTTVLLDAYPLGYWHSAPVSSVANSPLRTPAAWSHKFNKVGTRATAESTVEMPAVSSSYKPQDVGRFVQAGGLAQYLEKPNVVTTPQRMLGTEDLRQQMTVGVVDIGHENSFKLVGVSHYPAAARMLSLGEKVVLHADGDKQYDCSAVRVTTLENDETIGCIHPDLALKARRLIRCGKAIARVSDLHESMSDGGTDVTINLQLDDISLHYIRKILELDVMKRSRLRQSRNELPRFPDDDVRQPPVVTSHEMA